MKNSASNWLTMIVVLIVGIVLIVCHNRIDLLNWLVVAVGVALIVPSLYSVGVALSNHREVKTLAQDEPQVRTAVRSTMWASVGAIALGLWMVCVPGFFVGLVAYFFGAILVLYGIFHIVTIIMASKAYYMPWWFYIIPVLMIISGIIILCTDVRTMNEIVVLITGIALVASAVNSVFEFVGTNSRRRITD